MKKYIFAIFLSILFINPIFSITKGFEEILSFKLKDYYEGAWVKSVYRDGEIIIVWDGKKGIYLYSSNNHKTILLYKKKKFFRSYPSVDYLRNKIIVAYQVEENEKLYIQYLVVDEKYNIVSGKFPYSYDFSALPIIKCIKNSCFMIYHQYSGINKKKISLFISTTNDFIIWSNPESLVEGMSAPARGNFVPRASKVGNNRIFVVWQSRIEKRGKIAGDDIFGRFINFTGELSPIIRFTDDSQNDAPSVFVYHNKLHIIYLKRKPYWGLFYSIYSENGVPIKKEIRITKKEANIYNPKIYVYRDKVFFLWEEREPNRKVIYTKSLFHNELTPKIRITGKKESASRFNFIRTYIEPYFMYVSNNVLYVVKKDTTAKAPNVKVKKVFLKGSKIPRIVMRIEKVYDPSGIKEYWYAIDTNPTTIPDNTFTIPYNTKEFMIPELGEGIYYFHIRSVDNIGNISKTKHIRFTVSFTIPPKPKLIPEDRDYLVSKTRSPLIKWQILGYKKKIKGYEIFWDKEDFSLDDKSYFTTKNYIFLRNLSKGLWIFKVRGVDKDNNYGEVKTLKINIVFYTDVPSTPRVRRIGNTFFFDVVSKFPIKNYNYGVFPDPFGIPYNTTTDNSVHIKGETLIEGEKYYFKVSATDINNNEGPAAIVPFVYQIDKLPPTPPFLATKRIPKRKIKNQKVYIITRRTKELKFISRDNTGISGYSYVFADEKKEPPNQILQKENIIKIPEDLIPNKIYYLGIKAFDYDGNISSTTYIPIMIYERRKRIKSKIKPRSIPTPLQHKAKIKKKRKSFAAKESIKQPIKSQPQPIIKPKPKEREIITTKPEKEIPKPEYKGYIIYNFKLWAGIVVIFLIVVGVIATRSKVLTFYISYFLFWARHRNKNIL